MPRHRVGQVGALNAVRHGLVGGRRTWGLAGTVILLLSLWAPVQPWWQRLAGTVDPGGVTYAELRQDERKPPGQAAQPSTEPGDPLQGPALDTPEEILTMLDQRKRALDKKRQALHAEEAKLIKLKEEVTALLNRHDEAMKLAEAAERKRQTAEAKRRAEVEQRRITEQKKTDELSEARKAKLRQVAKMYEAMPTEEAAARIEKMPTATALKVLQLLRSKTAGNILGQVNADKAAKLTERYLKQQ